MAKTKSKEKKKINFPQVSSGIFFTLFLFFLCFLFALLYTLSRVLLLYLIRWIFLILYILFRILNLVVIVLKSLRSRFYFMLLSLAFLMHIFAFFFFYDARKFFCSSFYFTLFSLSVLLCSLIHFNLDFIFHIYKNRIELNSNLLIFYFFSFFF